VLKIVPATDQVWRRCLAEGLLEVFKAAGALVGNAGCAGCAAGQIGQNGPGEVTVSTGNRNYPGKQGKGEVYLASPAVAAASAVAGVITRPDRIPSEPVAFATGRPAVAEVPPGTATAAAPAMAPATAPAPAGSAEQKGAPGAGATARATRIRGRVWVIRQDNIDTDMIYHNRHLTVTDLAEMGQFTFGNLAGWEDFSRRALPGDMIVTGKNFGCGSARQQAVDCFVSLGIVLLIAESFGAIYERNAINKGFPIMTGNLVAADLKNGDEVEVALESGRIRLPWGQEVAGRPCSSVQLEIYHRGGLLSQ